MKIIKKKGKCLACGRSRYDNKPVLELTRMGEFHFLRCTLCGSLWSGLTKKDVLRQIDGSPGN